MFNDTEVINPSRNSILKKKTHRGAPVKGYTEHTKYMWFTCMGMLACF